MKATYIEYSETNSFSPGLISYINQDPELTPFISYQPDIEGFRKLLSNKETKADRRALTSVLKDQYAGIIASGSPSQKAVTDNIDLLSKETTYTVTTGHQLNLFTGPLYFIFKIVTAINLARELKVNFPDKDFVPVYWMATEDHDFEEINHTYIGGKKITWEHDAKGATGRICTKELGSIIKEYTGVLGISENSLKLAEIIESAYAQPNLAAATRYLVNALFKDYGLVIIDADHPALKKQFANIIQQDIIQQNSFKTINSSIEKLEAAGVHAQVNPREINFFYLEDNLRERIVYEDDKYRVLNTDIAFSEGELKQEIQSHPERFSPNVVMRPLYQEVILPNIAYVGGGAEVVYWLQLKATFEYYKVDFPILILRNSALVDKGKSGRIMNQLNLSPADLFKSAEELKKQWVIRHSEHTLNLADEWQEFKCLFERIKLRTHKIDPTLSPSTEAVKARLEKAIKNLEKKLIRAEKRNHSDSLKRIDNLKNSLFPNGVLQERIENFGLFSVHNGDEFIDSLINTFKPLDFKFTILQEEKAISTY
ncbi:bacillithiol biosynthesis cysteine-adding enzyme BshC [Flavihumibacter sp. R14]|nr:bacillithiol biosynthesis cysteine-adding enzyme BshC [Flavihumibacter soli]